MTEETVLALAGMAIVLAVPASFMVANWVRRNVDHGEARFDSSGRLISDEEKNDD